MSIHDDDDILIRILELETHGPFHAGRRSVFRSRATLLFPLFGTVLWWLVARPGRDPGFHGTRRVCSRFLGRLVDDHVDVGVLDGRKRHESSFAVFGFSPLLRHLCQNVPPSTVDQLDVVDAAHGPQFPLRSRTVPSFVRQCVQFGVEYVPFVHDDDDDECEP